MTEFDKEQFKLKLKLETRAARDYDSLVALGHQRGYKSPEFRGYKELCNSSYWKLNTPYRDNRHG